MVSRTSCNESHSSWALYYILLYTLDIGAVVVGIDYFVTWILVRASVLFILSRDTSYGFVLSQIASFIEWVANICSTIVVGWKWCLVMFVSREPKNIFLSLVSLQIFRNPMRNWMSYPAFILSSYDELRTISAIVALLHLLRITVIIKFLLVLSLFHSWTFILIPGCN